MAAKILTPAQANLELAILNAEAESMSSADFYAWLTERGLPAEAAIRLKSIAEVTATVGKRVISLGKLILLKIMEFVKAHAHLALGVAIGAAIGALANAVPLIGPLLAPVAMVIGGTIGALAGHRLDIAATGARQSEGLLAIGQDVIEIATSFFGLLAEILNLTLEASTFRGMAEQ